MKVIICILVSVMFAVAVDMQSYALKKSLVSNNGFDTLIYEVKIHTAKSDKLDLNVKVNIKSGPLANTSERLNIKINDHVLVSRTGENEFKIRIPLLGFDSNAHEDCLLKGSFQDAIGACMNNTCPDSLYFYKLPQNKYFIIVRIHYFTTNEASFPGAINLEDEIEIK